MGIEKDYAPIISLAWLQERSLWSLHRLNPAGIEARLRTPWRWWSLMLISGHATLSFQRSLSTSSALIARLQAKFALVPYLTGHHCF